MSVDQEPPKFDRRKKVWSDSEKLADYILEYRAKHGDAYPPSWEIMAEFQWSERMLQDRRDMLHVISKKRNIEL